MAFLGVAVISNLVLFCEVYFGRVSIRYLDHVLDLYLCRYVCFLINHLCLALGGSTLVTFGCFLRMAFEVYARD